MNEFIGVHFAVQPCSRGGCIGFSMSSTEQLMAVIKSKNIGKLSELLEKLDLDQINAKHNSQTALHYACRWKYNEAVDLLITKVGVDVNVKSHLGKTPLHVAIDCLNAHAASKILSNPGVDVNVQDTLGRTPLHYACGFNYYQIVPELLASEGVDVNVRDVEGNTPVMCSARGCYKEALKLLLEDTRVDMDAKDKDGEGLEVKVQHNSVIYWGDSKRKEKCLEMISNERRKRENSKVEKEQQSHEDNLGKGIEKIEKINKEMGDLQIKWKENVDIRKQKKRDLNERQSSEKEMMAKKHKEDEVTMEKKHKDEETTLKKKQKDEETTLKKKQKEEEARLKKKHKDEETVFTTFAREDEIEQRHFAILKELRNELAQKVQKQTIDPFQDTSGDHNKLEAAQRSFECPVCMDLMRPPTRIWMCRLSHIICEPCKDGLDKKEENRGKCPTCWTERVNLRAFMAENFASTIFNE